MKVHIPIKLPSLTNTRLHWREMVRLKKCQRTATNYVLINKAIPPPPLVVVITRVGPRKLDDDNLAAACKYVRDQIAKTVGVDDGSPLYTWIYGQRNGPDEKYGVDIEIRERNDEPSPYPQKSPPA